MLSVTKYPKKYIDECRAQVRASVAAYKKVAVAPAAKQKPLATAIAAFEPVFFNNMVLVLDEYFMHRARALELKDGNPCNEVRVLCNSLMENSGRLVADKQIRLNPATSVLGYAVGDEISLSAQDFTRLADAYFAEITAKFS